MKTLYKRVLLKISGEGLSAGKEGGVDAQALMLLAEQIKKVADAGVKICVVIGGGNIFRGAKDCTVGLDRSQADQIGMLATVINAVILKGALDNIGVLSEVMSGLSVPNVCQDYNYLRAIQYLQNGKVVIFAGGTGNPYFTTDTGAVLRAVEMHCDAVLKSSQIDGVYSADPRQNKKAVKYDKLSYDEVIAKNLRVMDLTAVTLAKDNKLPLVVFSQHEKDFLVNVIQGKGNFSIIKN